MSKHLVKTLGPVEKFSSCRNLRNLLILLLSRWNGGENEIYFQMFFSHGLRTESTHLPFSTLDWSGPGRFESQLHSRIWMYWDFCYTQERVFVEKFLVLLFGDFTQRPNLSIFHAGNLNQQPRLRRYYNTSRCTQNREKRHMCCKKLQYILYSYSAIVKSTESRRRRLRTTPFWGQWEKKQKSVKIASLAQGDDWGLMTRHTTPIHALPLEEEVVIYDCKHTHRSIISIPTGEMHLSLSHALLKKNLPGRWLQLNTK